MGPASGLGCETLVPSRDPPILDLLHSSPGRLLGMDTTGDETIFQKTDVQSLEGHKSNVLFAVYRPMLPIASEDGQSKSLLGYTLNCALHRARTMGQPGSGGGVVIPQLSLVESRGRRPESTHILLPPHELGSTEITANLIVHSPY